MKSRILIYLSLISTLFLSGCATNEDSPKGTGTINFIVRVSESSYNFARISVKHDGPEDLTWYGFLTTDTQSNEFELFYDKYTELITSGDLSGIRREQERSILLENLAEDTVYKYITFGIKQNGEMYDNVGIGSIEFKTSRNVYELIETKDWELKRLGRNEDKTKELIEVISHKGGRFGWNYISKESIEKWEKEYPDGYELWVDDMYMTTVNGIQMYALEQISTIQYYVTNGYELTELTYIYEADKPFEVDRLPSGEYYLIAYGFMGDGQHTQTYSVQEITIEEEPATEEYNKWLGTYTFTGEADITLDNGDVERKEISYNIRIEDYDNNYMYRVHGWECGQDVKYDWEEDIMQIDKENGEFLAFPAYFKDGSLELRESPMTYITFDGSTSLVLGIYGYAYNNDQKEEIPVILDETLMAIAEPIAPGETSTTLKGQHSVYTNGSTKVEWDYCKMGYIAWNEYDGSYQTVNPAMRFPITMTKLSNETPAPGSTATPANGVSLFSIKEISDNFLRNDFSKLEKMQPQIFDRYLK